MAVLVSHAMPRYHPTSPPSVLSTTYNLRQVGQGGDVLSSTSYGGSGALSRSMRYAEPWLYSPATGGGGGGFLLTPALVLCQCPEYLDGSKRGGGKMSLPHVCKKCGATRLPLNSIESKFGTVRCYPTSEPLATTPARAGTVRVTSTTSRPSILPSSADPYDLMRRSRLSVPENTASVSPFPTPKSKVSKCIYNGTGSRKSILECDINPYELMSKGPHLKQRQSLVYENVETPTLKLTKKPHTVRLNSTCAKKEKMDPNSNFKSILKKRSSSNYNSDSSPYSDVEEPPSPRTVSKQNGSKFYIQLRKKVQFLDDDDKCDSSCSVDYSNANTNNCPIDVVPKKVESSTKIYKIQRSNSDLANKVGKDVGFCDTMALRTKKRPTNCQNVFERADLAKLDGIFRTRRVSPRPNGPPPPPPAHREEAKVGQKNKIEMKSQLNEGKPQIEAVEDDLPPSAPPRKRSNSKLPTVAVDIKSPQISPSVLHESPNKTVVHITTPTSAVHTIKIKNEFPTQIQTINDPPRKTSILISGDECYSTVINDNVPLYQSSVVVNDDCSPLQITTTNNSSKIYINAVVPEPEESSSTLRDLLRDPVEAVKHNLVPHVCGKSDAVRRLRDLKFPKHTQPLCKAESPPVNTTNLSQSVQVSFRRLRNYESIDSEYGNNISSQYELMDQAESECYSNRSSVTEEELMNRTKFYELLAESGNIEVSEGDDHHYESIKINTNTSGGDPIYEEIEMPPPLPSNPPPATILDDLQLDKEYTTRSIFEGASKYDILSYLVDAKERGIVQEEGYTYHNGPQEEEVKEPYNRVSHLSTTSCDSSEDSSLIISGALIDEKVTVQKPAEVERNDSGVGSETSKSSLSKYRTKHEMFISCEDCDSLVENKIDGEFPLLCRKCLKRRSERKETIMEIVETEEKYGRDLQIMLEEFYQPMLVAGLLTPDQLASIFLNVEELLENSQALAERLRDAVEIALEQGDDDMLTVNIGKPFLEAAPMLHAFETYCVRQGAASLLLASLEKEKELLRIFLRVSQMENTMLRRMNLNSFLMVPVQRVTKYPLLLARLYKVTPAHYGIREQLKDAQHKIELHLNHMNSETKDVPSKLWRRIGSSSRRPSTEMDLVNIKLRKIAVDVLDWNHEEARFVLEGKLLFTQPTDNNWRKGRTIKLTPVNAMLVINGKLPLKTPQENALVFSGKSAGAREAALLLVRDKNGRYSLLREPLFLDRCVIAADPAWQSYFEVQELLNKDTFIFKAEDEEQTQQWYRKLQYHAQGMGPWRKRRNALANIMINGMGLRS